MTQGQAEFGSVYQRHYNAIRRFVGRRLAESEVDDATAEVFVVAWRRRAELPPDDRVLPWLYGVARRVLANEFRRAKRAHNLAGHVAHQRPVVIVADHAETVTSHIAVAAAFDRLSDEDQEIIRLVSWEELTSTQVAVVLDCARTTAAMRISRARRRLLGNLGTSPADALTNLLVGDSKGVN